MKSFRKISYIFIPILITFSSIFLSLTSLANAQSTTATQVTTSSAGLSVRVAPGELLPVSIKLANFGNGEKVDVLIQYVILSSSDKEIYSASDTVAVQTTNNFVKTIQIPANTSEGTYTVKTTITYPGQVSPAATQFNFTVETKIFGLFKNDFMLYGGITLVVGFLMTIIGTMLVRKSKLYRLSPLDYSDIPDDQRAFYELISDTIMSMRQKVGDKALTIARQIDGLVMDEKSGRILKLTDSPSKVVAQLVAGYEKVLGENTSFTFRNDKTK